MMLVSPICEPLLTVQDGEASKLAKKLEVSLNNLSQWHIMSAVRS